MNRFPHLFNPDRPQFHLLLFGIILFSTLSKLILYGLVMTYHPNGIFESSDSTEYQQLALNLFQQGTFSRSPQYPYDPEIIRTPAYPLMLAGIYRIFGVHPALVVFAQIALSVATIFISFKIATCLFHKQAGLLTAFLLAADPVSAYYTQVILTETAFTTTLSLCVLLLLYALKEPSRWQWSVGASLSLALSTYIRPTSYYLGFLLPFIFFLMIRSATGWRRASIPALAFFTLYGILVGSWQLHNYAQTGSMEFSQTKNQYLFVAKAAGIVAARDNLDLEEAQRRLATEHYQSIPPALRMAPPAQLLESQGQYAMNIIVKHPTILLSTSLKGLLASLFGPSNLSHLFGLDNVALRSSLLNGNFSGFSFGHWAMALSSWIYGFAFLIILYLGILMLFVRGGFYGHGTALLLFIVLYMLIVSSGPEAYSRFRLPIMPALCVMAAAGLSSHSRSTQPPRNTQRGDDPAQ